MTAPHDAFRAAVEAKDMDAMRACLHEDATFHSPAVFEPYAGRAAVLMILSAVTQVLQDFSYTHELPSDDDSSAVLVFEANVGDRQAQGIDLLTFDDTGLVTDLTVMIRPLRALEAVITQMGQKLAAIANP